MSMSSAEIRACKRCNRLFASRGSLICPSCLAKEDEIFKVIKEYLEKNPGKSAPEIAEDTQIPVEIVTDFIMRGRLMTVSSSPKAFCRICKKPIPSGGICDECKARLDHAAGEKPNLSGDKTEDGTRMYSRDSIHFRRNS